MKTNSQKTTNITTYAYDILSPGELQTYLPAWRSVFVVSELSRRKTVQIDSSGTIRYRNEIRPLIPPAQEKSEAEKLLWKYMGQLTDNLKEQIAPKGKDTGKEYFPPDFPADLFSQSNWKILTLEPEAHDKIPGLTRTWKAVLRPVLDAFAEITILGVTLTKKILLPIEGSTLTVRFAGNLVTDLDIASPIALKTTRKTEPLKIAAANLQYVTSEAILEMLEFGFRIVDGGLRVREMRGEKSYIEGTGFEYNIDSGDPNIYFGIPNKNKEVVAIYPYFYEKYKEDDGKTYKPIMTKKVAYKQYLNQLDEPYTERLRCLRESFEYLLTSENKIAKEVMSIVMYKTRFPIVFVPFFEGRNPGGGETGYAPHNGVSFYSVTFNPYHAIKIEDASINPMKFLGGISLSVAVIAHELSHVYELAAQREYINCETVAVSFDSLGDKEKGESWKSVTVKIINYVTLEVGSTIFRLIAGAWEEGKEVKANDEVIDIETTEWQIAQIKELFLKKQFIVVEKKNPILNYIAWIDSLELPIEKKNEIKQEFEKLNKNFPNWYEFYGVAMQDYFASGLTGETIQKVYLNSETNTLKIQLGPTTNRVSTQNPNYIPKENDK